MPVMDPITMMENERDLRVEDAIRNAPNEAEQLDQIAKIRGSYDPYDDANAVINRYMDSGLTVDEAAIKLAEPVEHCYTTADEGRAFHESESVAKHQRKHLPPEEAEEVWGIEQEFPEPTEDDRWKPSTESLLWRLWFAVCHVSRKSPWDDEEKQSKLVHLVRTLKARPDPPLPDNMTVPLSRDWIWGSGKLWSSLSMLGPSARETWDHYPGGGWGRTAPEVHAWTNTNAFFARLTLAEVSPYWNYGIWALRYVLEEEPRGNYRGSGAQMIDARLPAAAAWIRVAGREMYRYICENDADLEKRYDVNEPLPKLGWEGRGVYKMARWVFWKEKFLVMAERRTLAEETREVAAETANYMEEIESAHMTNV